MLNSQNQRMDTIRRGIPCVTKDSNTKFLSAMFLRWHLVSGSPFCGESVFCVLTQVTSRTKIVFLEKKPCEVRRRLVDVMFCFFCIQELIESSKWEWFAAFRLKKWNLIFTFICELCLVRTFGIQYVQLVTCFYRGRAVEIFSIFSQQFVASCSRII